MKSATTKVNPPTSTIIYVSPPTISAQVGQTFIIDVKIDNVQNLAGGEAKLGYNTSILHCIDSLRNETEPLGYIHLGARVYAPPITGNLTFVSIEFECIGSGECVLSLYDAKLGDSNANPIPHNVANGYFKTDTGTIAGDINADGKVDIYDAILLANAYASKPGDPNWNPNADINKDNIVDIYDAIVLANNYGK
jgi:hypothetical protein